MEAAISHQTHALLASGGGLQEFRDSLLLGSGSVCVCVGGEGVCTGCSQAAWWDLVVLKEP